VQSEPPDLDFFKELDRALLKKGDPHFIEILGARTCSSSSPPC